MSLGLTIAEMLGSARDTERQRSFFNSRLSARLRVARIEAPCPDAHAAEGVRPTNGQRAKGIIAPIWEFDHPFLCDAETP